MPAFGCESAADADDEPPLQDLSESSRPRFGGFICDQSGHNEMTLGIPELCRVRADLLSIRQEMDRRLPVSLYTQPRIAKGSSFGILLTGSLTIGWLKGSGSRCLI